MAKKAAKASKKNKATKKGNWLADANISFTRGAKNEDVHDRQRYVVVANDEESARKAAVAEHAKTGSGLDNLKLTIQVRPLTEKENQKWDGTKAVPIF